MLDFAFDSCAVAAFQSGRSIYSRGVRQIVHCAIDSGCFCMTSQAKVTAVLSIASLFSNATYVLCVVRNVSTEHSEIQKSLGSWEFMNN